MAQLKPGGISRLARLFGEWRRELILRSSSGLSSEPLAPNSLHSSELLAPDLLHHTGQQSYGRHIRRVGFDMSRIMPTILGLASLHSLQVLVNYSRAAIAQLPNLRILDVSEVDFRGEQEQVVDLSRVAELRLRITILGPLNDTSQFGDVEFAQALFRCTTSLKTLRLMQGDNPFSSIASAKFDSRILERLLGLINCARSTLETLELPPAIGKHHSRDISP
ncbi:hypothetical protein K505DRAFT_76253 [Melanomma pulvis-pyrius CBS 109.77]|uniref:Uncharacterized protein n=1 Tax=Melanomma pulvis-pyrius CBS 109.77 TaxID=1314802 RepID=A0A6A6X4B1_9PLEO|nr:hypothetical protein K505DRAFT_76253 [Melanomma pulvis-pyrius CBS 109.77]